MTNETAPLIRRDLDFLPVQHGGQQIILIRDHLGLVQEGKAISLPLYQIMALLDGTSTIRDLQVELMRQKGGVLVGTDEVESLLAQLDHSFFLDSERFKTAREQLVADFTAEKVRPCSHCGSAYPENPAALKSRLDEIVTCQPPVPEPEGEIVGLVSPHIDLSVGQKVYSSAYQMLKHVTPSTIVLLGVGHQMANDLFSLTDKDFETPLGIVKNEPSLIQTLRETGRDIVSATDFAHRSEHSIEFQVIFLQHLLAEKPFTIIPILCGSLQSSLPEFNRNSYLQEAGPFLEALRQILTDKEKDILLVAGVDFSHIGPKFGHEMPAQFLKPQSEAHDKNLLKALCQFDADPFWEESRNAEEQFHVCGFSALACLLEVLPPCKGKMLDYQVWDEAATRSAVSFSSVVFTS